MKLTNKTLRWILLGTLGISIIVFFVVMIEGLSLLSSKSRKLVDLKIQSQTADAQLANLEQTKKDVEKYSYFKSVAQSVIPNDKNQAQTVLELNQMASQAGFSLQSITFPTSTLGGASGTANAVSSSSLSAISQAKPVSGIAGLYSLELTVTANSSKTPPNTQQITYAQILNFLDQIEKSRRTAQIAQVSIEPDANAGGLDLSLQINIFMKP